MATKKTAPKAAPKKKTRAKAPTTRKRGRAKSAPTTETGETPAIEAPPEVVAEKSGAHGAHRSPHMDDAVGQVGFNLWESKTDVLSIEQIRKILETTRLSDVAKTLTDTGLGLLRRAVTALISSTGERQTDEFGCDRAFIDEIIPFARWVHDHYFRVETRGIENIPDEGRVLLVANHSGTLPYDGSMVVATVFLRHPQERLIRALVENVVYHFPYFGMFMSRVGAVRACQENAIKLLERDEPVLVFPEGVKGIGKLFRKRYQLQRFGRGGAIKLALKTGSRIVPVSLVGAEESMPLLSKVSWLARPLGLPYIPVTPTLPLLGPLGLIPFPTKWYIDFGESFDMASYGPDAIHDRVLVNRLNEEIRQTIQDMINRRLAERRSVFGG